MARRAAWKHLETSEMVMPWKIGLAKSNELTNPYHHSSTHINTCPHGFPWIPRGFQGDSKGIPMDLLGTSNIQQQFQRSQYASSRPGAKAPTASHPGSGNWQSHRPGDLMRSASASNLGLTLEALVLCFDHVGLSWLISMVDFRKINVFPR